jgi:hypothetical protein
MKRLTRSSWISSVVHSPLIHPSTTEWFSNNISSQKFSSCSHRVSLNRHQLAQDGLQSRIKMSRYWIVLATRNTAVDISTRAPTARRNLPNSKTGHLGRWLSPRMLCRVVWYKLNVVLEVLLPQISERPTDYTAQQPIRQPPSLFLVCCLALFPRFDSLFIHLFKGFWQV